MYEFPKPGAEHQTLAMLAGDWNSEVRFYFDAASEPMVKAGTYQARLDLGGYFLRREFLVDLDDAGEFKALAFHGYGLTGYDPFQRKYLGVWVDSGSPALYFTEGSFDASGDIYTETSRGPDATGKPMTLRMVTSRHGENRLKFNLFRLDGGANETLITEMEHTLH
jgi:hypothetical protein